MKFIYVAWVIAVTFTFSLVKARPRSLRQAGSLPTACLSRERLTDSEGTLESPNFPGPYPANSSCIWIITAPQNTNVSLKFTSFNVQSNSKQCDGSKCHCDFVQVKELDPPPNSAGFSAKYCDGNRPPDKIPYLMSRVRIRFVSDFTGEGTGFQLNYKVLQRPSTAGTIGGAGVSVDQTVATTIAGAITKKLPTKARSSSSLNQSEFSIPLSTFTSKAQTNSTPGVLLHVTPETRRTPEFNGARTPLPGTFPVTSAGGRSVWTTPTHVVIAVEQKKVEEKVPDIIVLGPSVPVVMIFVLVVAGIAWWNYKFNSEELNRYESYAKNSAAKKRQKKTMHNISKGNLYNEMTKTWRGQSYNPSTGSSPMVGRYRKISFAGRLLEGVRTPRPSRPPSSAEETMPLTKPSTGTGPGPFLSPGAATTGGGSRPSSRPASLLLRDALVNMFGGTEEGETQTQGSGSPSKRTSKRVSFIDEEAGQPLVQQESTPPEQIEETHDEPVEDDNMKEKPDAPEEPPRKLLIPAILVRQPSEDIDFTEESPSRSSREDLDDRREEDAIIVEASPHLEAMMPDQDADDEAEEDGDDDGSPWNDLGANYPDSSLEDIPDRSLIFPDLEDFLLNLDKDSDLDEPPYSCAVHIRDILRKSYGDEGPSSLGPETVLNVPEEFLGLLRNSSLSRDGTTKETDLVDDVD